MRFFTFLILLSFFSCTKKAQEKETAQGRILFIVSNQHTYGDTSMNAANHFGEIVFAYDVFIKNGYQIDFVSPKGGAIPIGYLQTSDPIQKSYIYNVGFMEKLKTTFKPNLIEPKDYHAVYYVGGGAAMFGVPENEKIQALAMSVYNNNGVVSAICHGTAGIVNLKNADGSYLFANKNVNGFPDKFENKNANYYKTFPFSIEQMIKKRGGKFSSSDKGWDNYFKVDGRLITGQDPTAAASVANEIIKTLNTINK